MKQPFKLILCAALVFSVSAFANNFKTVGQAKMQYLLWDVYHAKLETPSGTYTFGQHPSKLTLTYLRDFDAKDIVKATNEQWQHLKFDDMVGAYDETLLALWPDIKKNDSLSFQTNEQGVGTFYFNGKELGQVNDDKFADNFLAIWLSANTSEPSLRQQLVGEKYD